MNKDLETVEKTEDSLTVRISGATYRNLEKLNLFLRAQRLELGAGPWGGENLDLETTLKLAGSEGGFLGERAYSLSGSELKRFDLRPKTRKAYTVALQVLDFE